MPSDVEVRLRKLKLNAAERIESHGVLALRQVLVVLRGDDGKPYFIAGFRNNSDIAKIFRRFFKPMDKLPTDKG